MNDANGRHILGVAAALALGASMVAGCSSTDGDTTSQTVAAATAAQSPPTTSTPAGTVHRFAGHAQSAVTDTLSHSLVVLSDGGTSVAVFTLAALDAPRHTIGLPQPATALITDGRGIAYAATQGGFYRIDLAAGHAEKVPVPGHEQTSFRALTRHGDGTLVLGGDDGTVYTLGADNRVAATTSGFSHVDALAAQGNTTVVLDRQQSSVTTLTADGSSSAHALRAGSGATTMLADKAGQLLVADTRAGALLVFGIDPLILRQYYPVPNSPYGIATSPKLSWVSQTATNTVIGYDLSTGIPVERARYSTVRQPDSLASDGTTLFVVSATGDGIQTIDIGGAG